MPRTRGWLVLLACALFAAWLAWVPARNSPPPPASPPDAAAPRPADPDEIRQRVGRLRDRLASSAPLAPSHRNPFQFQAPAAVTAAGRATGKPPTTAAETPPRPEMSLLGIAEDGTDGARVRTAVVSVLDQLYFLKEGDKLLERYLVLRVVPNGVELKDGQGGTLVLTLK